MPKPENPGKPENDHPHGPTVDKFIAKGWLPLTITAGSFQSEDVPIDSALQDVALLGVVFAADGSRMKGRGHPRASVEETETMFAVSLAKPAPQDVTVLYKIEEVEPEPELAA